MLFKKSNICIFFSIILVLNIPITSFSQAENILVEKIKSRINDKYDFESNIISNIQGKYDKLNISLGKKDIGYISSDNLYDYGYKVGRMLKKQINIKNVFENFFQKIQIEQEKITEITDNYEKTYPLFFNEMQGFSKGIDLDLNSCIFLHNFMSQYLVQIGKECTSTLSTGKATKNNETFLTQNVDQELKGIGKNIYFFFLRSITFKLWIVDVKSVKYMYCYFGIPIIFEFPLLNEKGLGWGANGLLFTEEPGRGVDEGPGVATFILERTAMMNCKNVSEVADLWKNSDRASGKSRTWPHFWDNSNTHWCDAEGGILTIEQTHNHIITVFGNSTDITGGPEDILWHANHHQWLDPIISGSVTPSECQHSYLRSERAKELLINNYGNITLDFCKSITRDYKGGNDKYSRDDSDICRYPSDGKPIQTVFSWIIQPKLKTVYITFGPPDRFSFIKFNLEKIFDEYDKKSNNFSRTYKTQSLTNNNQKIKIWDIQNKDIFFENRIENIEDAELLKYNTYENLKVLFNGCETPRDFYQKIQEEINDYFFEDSGNKNTMISIKNENISDIVNVSIDSNTVLCSYQQALLLAAGIKSIFSVYNEEENQFELKPNCGDFKIEIWRSKCYIPPIILFRSRLKIVVDVWNGTDLFELNGVQYDKIELDTYQNNYRGFNKFNDFLFCPISPSKLNSVLITNNI